MYAPVSACGHGCLPKPGTTPAVGVARRGLRLIGILVALLAGVLVAAVIPMLGATGRARLVRSWFRGLLRAAGVRLRVIGDAALAVRPAGDVPVTSRSAVTLPGTLIVANHVSWLDIPAILAVEPARVVAKTDVRRWPVIGVMAARAGTIFIDRRRVRRLPATVAEVATSLHNGHNVLVFPEGSTWCGRTHGQFYPAAFQAAIDAGAPVRPVALRYRLADRTPTTAAAFVGDDTLLASVLRVISTRGLTIELESGPVADARGAARRSMATAVGSAVRGSAWGTVHACRGTPLAVSVEEGAPTAR